jgi:hypothetical protein
MKQLQSTLHAAKQRAKSHGFPLPERATLDAARGVSEHLARSHTDLAMRTVMAVGPAGSLEMVIPHPGGKTDIEISFDPEEGPSVLTVDERGGVLEEPFTDATTAAEIIDRLIG